MNSDGYRAAWIPTKPSDPGYEFITREVRAHQALQIGAVGASWVTSSNVSSPRGVGASDAGGHIGPRGRPHAPGGLTRKPSRDNTDELFRVPLFIKAPGQTAGQVR